MPENVDPSQLHDEAVAPSLKGVHASFWLYYLLGCYCSIETQFWLSYQLTGHRPDLGVNAVAFIGLGLYSVIVLVFYLSYLQRRLRPGINCELAGAGVGMLSLLFGITAFVVLDVISRQL